VVGGGEDIGQRQHERVVGVVGERLGHALERAVGQGDPDELRLAPLHLAAAGQNGWKPQAPPWRQDVWSPRRQKWHAPQEIQNGEATFCPTRTFRTSEPISSTTPTNSWPRRQPGPKPKASPWL
jgi:hypothetical protein